MLTKQRNKVYLDTVAFPETKSAGTAKSITSDILYPFASNPGELNLHVVADDASKITDNLTVKAEISYDSGTSWITAGTYTDLDNGSGEVSEFKSAIASFAPMVKLTGTFDSSGALAEGHGCKLNAELKEDSSFQRFKINQDIVTVPDSLSVVADVAASGILTLTGVVIDGETASIGDDTYEFAADVAQSVSGDNIAVDITSYTTASEGTLTVDTQPTVGEEIVVGSTTYTFVADGDEDTAGEISVGTDLATAQANIVAAINGTDGINSTNASASIASFATNDAVLTALIGGSAGDTITTTTTMAGGTNAFDDATLGTTTAGADCSAANAITALVDAVTNSGTVAVSASDGEGDTIDFTADVAGSAGNSITTTETMTNGEFDNSTLTGGSDSIDVETEGDAIEISQDNVKKVIVVSSADASKLTDIAFKLQSSIDGVYWWDATSEVDISSTNFLETEVTSKLGTYFKVVLIAGEDTGSASEGHSINFDLVSLYA